MSSDIPRARDTLQRALDTLPMSDKVRRAIRIALSDMTRQSAIRHAPPVQIRIDSAVRSRVRALARSTDMTITEIAAAVGLRNNGRVSEILHRKR